MSLEKILLQVYITGREDPNMLRIKRKHIYRLCEYGSDIKIYTWQG